MKNVLTVIGVGTVLGVAFLIVMQILFPFGNLSQGDEIAMCQPTGWNLWRDSYCAQEINKPNSEANLNNGLAHAANAEATHTVAQAQYYESQTRPAPITMFGSGLYMGCCGMLLLVGVVAAVAARSRAIPN